MKTLEYTFDTTIEFSGNVREHAFVLRCLPRAGEGVTVLKSSLEMEPELRLNWQHDSFGNELAVGCAREPHDRIGYHSRGIARVDLSSNRAMLIHPLFKYPSPLTVVDDDMRAWMAGAGFNKEAFTASTVARFEAFERLGKTIHEMMAYEPGTTSIATTAAEAFAERRGVCQDFAHIMVAVLREAGVPARYVSGLVVGEGTTHAWAQAYVDGRWHGFDPTRNARVDETYLPLAIGRDWSDCPVERGSFWGLVDQTQTVFMTMKEVEA